MVSSIKQRGKKKNTRRYRYVREVAEQRSLYLYQVAEEMDLSPSALQAALRSKYPQTMTIARIRKWLLRYAKGRLRKEIQARGILEENTQR